MKLPITLIPTAGLLLPPTLSMKSLLKTIALLSAFANPLTADHTSSIAWFESAMKGGKKVGEDIIVPLADLGKTKKSVFDSYKKAAVNQDLEKQFPAPNIWGPPSEKNRELKSSRFHIAEGLDMPYLAVQRGKRPTNGWPLTIAMHGGGGTGDKLANPHAWPVNSREWKAQINLAIKYYPTDMIYFVPRMVDDNQGRWWKEFNHTAFTAMIRHAILFWDVDPNRIYMLGISEGGYGTETLACRYPDRLAAANGMACGSGTSIHVENLRNLPFRTDVGEKDTMFKRQPNAVAKHKLLEELRKADPKGYENHLEVYEGRGHGIDYRPGPKWMVQKTRTPHPDRVTYTLFEHDKVKNKGAYWIEALNDLDKKVIKLDARIDSKRNIISIDARATIKDEAVQAADWQQPLTDPGETKAASGLKLRLWLHDKLLDLDKPIKIRINGKTVKTDKVTPSLVTMQESLMQFGDPEFIYPAQLEVVVP